MEARTVEVAPADYRFRSGQGLTEQERRAALRAITLLSRRLGELVPEDGGEVLADVADQVFASFKARDDRTTDETVLRGFLIALPGRADAAVREAIRRLIRHEAGTGYSRVYVPTASEVASLTQTIEAEWRVEVGRLQLLLTRGELKPAGDGEATPEWTAKMQAMGERLTRAAAVTMRKPFGGNGTRPGG